MKLEKNFYGSLCTQMYELLPPYPRQDDLNFYLSYAHKLKSQLQNNGTVKILEPLCGCGRFLLPFLEHGFDITGVDASEHMLNVLRHKAPLAKVIHKDILKFTSPTLFDYIFISSGSVSLFTNIDECQTILTKLKTLMSDQGVLVFAVDSIANIQKQETDYTLKAQELTKDGHILKFYSKDQYDSASQTQFMHSIYELCDRKSNRVIQTEYMDFQTHLYAFGQMEAWLTKMGFSKVNSYQNFNKVKATGNDNEMFLFECHL